MEGLVSTAWMAEHLGERGMVTLDLRSSFALYEEKHIPGAQFLHLETLRMSKGGVPCIMHDPPVLAAIFGRLGITTDTPVIAYAMNPEDHVSATYALWALAVTGNPHIRLLDGNMQKWQEEQRPLTQEYPAVSATQYDARFNSDIYADWQYVGERLDDPNVVLVDSRTVASYEGSEGITMRLGHIPGAVVHNYLWDFARDGTYQPEERLRERYEQKGITPDKEIITYCVTGREGSANWFMLKYLLGYPRVRLYQASLTEWAAHRDLPMVTGPSPYGSESPDKAA